MRSFIAAVVALGSVAITCIAATAPTPGIEKTPIPAMATPDFSTMFPGRWHCSYKSSRRATPFETTDTRSVSRDGYWLVIETTIGKTPQNGGFHSTDRITYDASTKRWVDMEADEKGYYEVSTSPGWHGRSMVWTDVLAPQGAGVARNNPTTITRVSEAQFTTSGSFVEKSGRLITVKGLCMKM